MQSKASSESFLRQVICRIKYAFQNTSAFENFNKYYTISDFSVCYCSVWFWILFRSIKLHLLLKLLLKGTLLTSKGKRKLTGFCNFWQKQKRGGGQGFIGQHSIRASVPKIHDILIAKQSGGNK